MDRAIAVMESTSAILDGFYQSRSNAVEKCYKVALSRGYKVFAVHDGGACAGSPDAESTYKKYGPSSKCKDDGKGGKFANEVYEIQGKY